MDASYRRSQSLTRSVDNPKNAPMTPRYRMSAITPSPCRPLAARRCGRLTASLSTTLVGRREGRSQEGAARRQEGVKGGVEFDVAFTRAWRLVEQRMQDMIPGGSSVEAPVPPVVG